MRQDTTTISDVAREFKLSEYEEKFLLTCERGEGAFKTAQSWIIIRKFKVVSADGQSNAELLAEAGLSVPSCRPQMPFIPLN